MARKKTYDFTDHPLITRAEARSSGLKRYFTGKPCTRGGHVAPRYTKSNNCVICMAQDALAYQKYMYAEHADEWRAAVRARSKAKPLDHIFRGAKSRALKRGIEFTIVKSDLSVPENCPCCQRKIELKVGAYKQGPDPASPSIDRFDNSLGYVPGNVTVICWRCNELKRNGTLEEFRAVVAWMERKTGVHIAASGNGYEIVPPIYLAAYRESA